MKTIWFVVNVVMLIICVALPTRASVIWSDGFESGDLSDWTNSTGNWKVTTSTEVSHSGTKGADIFGPTSGAGDGGDYLTVLISTVGFKDITLSYWWKVREALETNEFVSGKITFNSNNWWSPPELRYDGPQGESSWQRCTFLLPSEASDNPSFGIRFRAVLSSSSDRMHFDDFELFGTPIPEPATLGLLCLGSLVLARKRKQ